MGVPIAVFFLTWYCTPNRRCFQLLPTGVLVLMCFQPPQLAPHEALPCEQTSGFLLLLAIQSQSVDLAKTLEQTTTPLSSTLQAILPSSRLFSNLNEPPYVPALFFLAIESDRLSSIVLGPLHGCACVAAIAPVICRDFLHLLRDGGGGGGIYLHSPTPPPTICTSLFLHLL